MKMKTQLQVLLLAATTLMKIQAQSPVDPLAEPKALLAHGLTKDAETAINIYLQTNPNSADGHYLRAEIFFREQRAKESLAEFTTGAKGRNPTAREFGIIASDYVLLGDYVDADRWFTRATAHDPAEASYWYLLGRTRYKEGEYADAVSAFERALSLHPRYVEAENNRGLALSVLQEKDLAAQAFQQAIDWQGSSGTDSQPYFNLGSLLLEQNELTKAVALLKKAVTLSPSNPRMHEELGKAYVQQGDLSLAEREMETAVALSPETSSLHFRLGQIYKKQSKDDLAKNEFAICAKLAGTHSSKETPNPFGPE
jgi:tetratricopeptide (TPR) repeat protein